MVTAEKVWAALAELPDPEIPVISLVDLGVVREVEVEGERVRVEFTPTFLGCPAQEVMRGRQSEAVPALGAEPQIDVGADLFGVRALGPFAQPAPCERTAGP